MSAPAANDRASEAFVEALAKRAAREAHEAARTATPSEDAAA